MTTTAAPPAAPGTSATTLVPKASLRDSVALLLEVVVPTVAKGPVIRRPALVGLAERLQLDRTAIRRMQRLRKRYGPGPLRVHFPFQPRAVVLAPEHVHRVLAETPDPFATASSEKVAALAHFEPKLALVSRGADRAERRRFNEEVLDLHLPAHRLGERFLGVVREEAEGMLAAADARGELTWDEFAPRWFRVVRRIVLGDGAADDEELTDLLARLRSDANWGPVRPRRTALRERFHARLRHHLERAEPGSLAAIVAETPVTERTAPEDQAPQWLFAFDPAGMATFRALALLASHPEHGARARQEIRSREGISWSFLPFLRACLLESLRLWPTTPMVLRETTRETAWESGTMPARTGILIFAPFFHRDDRRVPWANTFSPELWMEERTDEDWPLVPFSGGPGLCPGMNIVLLVGSGMLAALLAERDVRLVSHPIGPDEPLPALLNNYGLRFAVSAGERD